MLEQIIIVAHVVVAVVIIAFILLQQGKGAEMGASFGGGSSQSVFGAQGGGNLLTKWTAILVTIFLATSLSLAYFAHQKSEALFDVQINQRAVEDSFALPVKEGEVGAKQNEQNDVPQVDVPAAPAESNQDVPTVN